ncbi:MAG: sugar phosphate isomerase/epimerase family protein [Thermoguttaceae bacterium]
MKRTETTRRNLLQSAAGTLGLAVAGRWVSKTARAAESTAAASGTLPAVRLGGPVFRAPADPEGLALAHKKLGYRAAYCPGMSLNDRERIRDTTAAFQKHGVILAEVGRWVNLLDHDSRQRAANLNLVTEGLALAEALQARCCVDIAGSYSPTSWFGPHPDNFSQTFFDATVENARKIIDAVKPKRAKFCFEVMGWAIPHTPDVYVKLIRAVDRPAFAAHLDPCNLVNSPERFYQTKELLDECFDKLGPWIVSCHAKDVAWSNPVEMNVHILEVLPGTGVLDYATYLKRLAALPGEVPLMLEHLRTAEEYDKARKYIMETGSKAGVRFE